MIDGHRLMTFQVEGQVLRGPDADAEAIALFALEMFAAMDGRPVPESPASKAGRRVGTPGPRRSRRSSRVAATGAGGPRPPGAAELDGPVIFDLDGVLVDSEIWWDEVRQAFAVEHGRTWTRGDRASRHGRELGGLGADDARAPVARRRASRRSSGRSSTGWSSAAGARAARGSTARSTAVRRIAADRPVAIASSAHRAVIDAALAATGLDDVFRVVVSSDEVEHGKPAPDVYLLAAERLGADPVTCLVVEDSLNGVKAAKAAGMTVVLVPNASVPPPPGRQSWRTSCSTGSRTSTPSAVVQARSSRRGGAAAGGRNAAVGRPVRPRIRPWRLTIRYWASRIFVFGLTRAIFRIRFEGGEHLPPGPAIYCFNHLSWVDPFVLMAILPFRPRLFFFGPKEEDMASAAGTGSCCGPGRRSPTSPARTTSSRRPGACRR